MAMTLIEDNWKTLEAQWMSPQAGDAQREECRDAFFAGAQCMWGIMMQILGEEGMEFEKMDALQAELDVFIAQFRERNNVAGEVH